jgi:hypothetical protein
MLVVVFLCHFGAFEQSDLPSIRLEFVYGPFHLLAVKKFGSAPGIDPATN